jgi:hypothetical protein
MVITDTANASARSCADTVPRASTISAMRSWRRSGPRDRTGRPASADGSDGSAPPTGITSVARPVTKITPLVPLDVKALREINITS